MPCLIEFYRGSCDDIKPLFICHCFTLSPQQLLGEEGNKVTQQRLDILWSRVGAWMGGPGGNEGHHLYYRQGLNETPSCPLSSNRQVVYCPFNFSPLT